MVKKAVGFKSEGPDKAYAEIDDPEGPVRGRHDWDRKFPQAKLSKHCSNRGSVQSDLPELYR